MLLHECSTYTEDDTMAGHTALGRISELVELVDVERIVLVHLPPVSAKEEGAIRRQLKRRFGNRVVLGEDGSIWKI